MVKINTNATLDLTNKAIGLGAICRDDKGRVLGAAYAWLNLPISVNAVEAKALLLGATLSKELQVDSFILESDCLQVISVAKRGGNPLCDFGNILKDVDMWLEKLIASIYVVFLMLCVVGMSLRMF